MLIEKFGKVVVSKDEILIGGFEFGDDPEGTCRKAAMTAMLWAIGELQKDIAASLDKPGQGKSVLD